MKGRRTPPKITIDQAAAEMLARPGLYILEIRHDDDCPTIRTQRAEHCTCKDVEQHLVRWSEGWSSQ